jgi:hypothetical protein
MIAAIEDLLSLAPSDRRPVLIEQLELLTGAIDELDRDPRDSETALVPDIQGFGVAAGQWDGLGTADRAGSLRRP